MSAIPDPMTESVEKLLQQADPTIAIGIKLVILGRGKVSERAYDAFLELVDEALTFTNELMERQRQDTSGLTEDQLSMSYLNVIAGMGFKANPQRNGGNVDMFVSYGPTYSWLGEAKKYDGPAYLYEGYLQLTTRYAAGSTYQRAGGIVAFCDRPRTDLAMQDWAKHLAATDKGATVSSPKDGETEFRSTYVSDITGRVFKVRHMAVSTYFQPQDKSGRKRQRGGGNESASA